MNFRRFFFISRYFVFFIAVAISGDFLNAGWETYNPFVGVTYSKLRDSDSHSILGWTSDPLDIDVMEIDLGSEGISFLCTPPAEDVNEDGETIPQTTMNFMKATGTEIAVNTMYFQPWEINGLSYSNGEKVSDFISGYAAINISRQNQVELITAGESSHVYPYYNAFAGKQVVVNNSAVVDDQTTARHPRTAAGYNAAENKLILMTVDGRSSSSIGVTLKELGKLMLKFGSNWAVNLDGGGSTQMTMNTGTPVYVNTPSETYRAVGSNLGVNATVDDTYQVFANFEHGNKATFEYAPGYSGSSYGFIEEYSTALLTSAAAAGRGAMKVFITDDTSVAGEWFTRIVSGSSATRSQNIVRKADGYVGFMAKTTNPNTFVSLAIDDPNTGDRGTRKAMIADGKWHWYQWNLDDADQWEAWVSEGDGTVNNADFTLDSLQIWGSSSATVYVDEIAHRSNGTLSANPVAVNDVYNLSEDQSLEALPSAGLLANDTYETSEPFTVIKVSDPQHGTLELNPDGSFRYAPDTDWKGEDTFTYKANDGYNDSNVAVVRMVVEAADIPEPSILVLLFGGMVLVIRLSRWKNTGVCSG